MTRVIFCQSDMAQDVRWTHWSWWSLCNNPCNTGTRTRSRTCIPNSEASHGGTNYSIDLAEHQQSCAGNAKIGNVNLFISIPQLNIKLL